MSEALVLVDIQNDYFPGGAMEVVGAKDATQKARSLLTAFRDQGKPVVHIQHLSTREGATFFLPGTAGVEIHESVIPLAEEKVIRKNFPNSFRDTELAELLQEHGVTAITFAGMMTHMCIDATVRAAFDMGFNCVVAADACATRNLAHGGVAVESDKVQAAYLSALGAVYAKVNSSEEIIARLGGC